MAGLGFITAVVAPVFHTYVPPPDAVSVAVCPEQIVALPDMFALGVGFIFTVTEDEEVHPLESVTVTT